MWNHLLRWRGTDWQFHTNMYQLTSDGKAVLATDGLGDQQMPYYQKDGDLESFAASGDYWLVRLVNAGPPIRAGEAIVGRENVDASKSQSWVYLTGQRRVRKLPNPCCDTPTPAAAGVMSFDEIEVFTSSSRAFRLEAARQEEMIVPYNGNPLAATQNRRRGSVQEPPEPGLRALGAASSLVCRGDPERGQTSSGIKEPLLLRRGHLDVPVG